MCHVGLIRSHEVDDTFAYAEKTLKGANRACEAQVGSMYNLVSDVCRKKVDSHINLGQSTPYCGNRPLRFRCNADLFGDRHKIHRNW